MIADPQPTAPEPQSNDTEDATNDGRSATAPAEGAEHVGGTPRDPQVPDD